MNDVEAYSYPTGTRVILAVSRDKEPQLRFGKVLSILPDGRLQLRLEKAPQDEGRRGHKRVVVRRPEMVLRISA